MQLSLFDDNRPGLLHNFAHEFILSRNLEQALSVYDQLLTEYPDDRQAASMKTHVTEWRDLLDSDCLENPGHLHLIWRRLATLKHPALRNLALETLIDSLRALPDGKELFIEPDFHLGRALMEAGRYAEAAECFRSALFFPALPRGRFLAWTGDALTMAGKGGDALASYLAAFLDDPRSVDLSGVRNGDIRFLHESLAFEADEAIGERDIPAWLPVWGWLQDVFALPSCGPGELEMDAARLEAQLRECPSETGRIWFEMLILAERLRAGGNGGPALVALRRVMKRANAFLFDCYLEKIG